MKRKMHMKDAMSLVDDDMPDGAYWAIWAMVHEMAGAEYGEAWDEVIQDSENAEEIEQEKQP